MRVVAYLRVSTDRQAERGYGLQVQERAVRAWARSGGHRVVAVYTDAGVAGSNGLGSRVALADAMEAIRSGRAAGIVVARLDRLARDLIVQEQVLAEVRRIGGDVLTTAAGEAHYLTDDPDDPSRKLIRQVLGAVSEYERSMVALRLRAGRRRKAERGGFAYGSPPYGSRVEGGVLVSDDEQQRALRRIAGLRAEGRSFREIADVLTAEGHRPRRSDRWHPESLRRIAARL